MTTKIEPGRRTFINAKIQTPPAPAALLAREKFNDLLYETRPAGLLLVHAPAGYGKTTTLAERLGVTGANAAWYRLDVQDNNVSQFAAYLAQTLETAKPGTCLKTLKHSCPGASIASRSS